MKQSKQFKRQARVADRHARQAQDEEIVKDFTYMAAAYRSQARVLKKKSKKKKN